MWIAASAVVALAVLTAGGVWLKRLFDGPMFEPGTVAARVAAAGESLEPMPSDSSEDAWHVTPEIQLFHQSRGQGEDLLLLHGGPGFPPREPWRAAELLAAGYRVHSYHQRGCGRSSRPLEGKLEGSFYSRLTRVEATLGFAEQLADVERIRRRLGSQKLILVGLSFGGLIAALYAAEFPERVRALVLLAPAPLEVMPTEGKGLFEGIAERLPEAERGSYQAYLASYFDLPASLDLDEAALSRKYGGLRRFYRAAEGAPQVPDDDGDAGGFLTAALYAGLGRRHDWRAALGRVEAPTLVLHGAEDLQSEADTRRFASAIHGARVEILPGAGHFMAEEAPEAVAEAVRRFIVAGR